MYRLLIFLPLKGSCLAGLFGRYLGSTNSTIVTTTCLFLSFLASIFSFYEVALRSCFVYIKLATWISLELVNVDWGFLFDSLMVTMCVVVTFISFLFHFYSTEYMSHDPRITRFMFYLSLFTFFMFILVTADNFMFFLVLIPVVGKIETALVNLESNPKSL